MSEHVAPESQRVGTLTSTDLDRDRVVTRDLVCCVHCGYLWVWEPGSGKRRGWCLKCGGFVCGHKACVQTGCVHRNQQLENMEQGRPLDFVPVVASVPVEPPRK